MKIRWRWEEESWCCKLNLIITWHCKRLYFHFFNFHRFFYIDLVTRLIFSAILILVIFLLIFFIFDRDTFFERLADIFYSAKYMISNNFVVPRNVSCPLDIWKSGKMEGSTCSKAAKLVVCHFSSWIVELCRSLYFNFLV